MTYRDLKVVRVYTAAATINVNATLVVLGGTDTAYTLPGPNGLPNGHRMTIKPIALTAFAVNYTDGFNDTGDSGDFANFAGVGEDEFLQLVAYNDVWYTLGSSGVTIAAT